MSLLEYKTQRKLFSGVPQIGASEAYMSKEPSMPGIIYETLISTFCYLSLSVHK